MCLLQHELIESRAGDAEMKQYMIAEAAYAEYLYQIISGQFGI